MMPAKNLICVVGPTAIGKTKLAIALANHFHTEVVSADSRQFYREMRIGTAVPEPEELEAAPHHFIQHLSIEEPYSVGTYEKDAVSLLEQLFKTHNEVVLVGGSGLYVDAVTRGLDEFPEITPGTREALQQQLQEEGIQSLQRELKQSDPSYYDEVDLENPHRLIRALEVCRSSGAPYSSFRRQQPAERNFRPLYVGLEAPREILYSRINTRVDLMLEAGLVEEARNLYPRRELSALQTVGYKELFRYFEGSMELEEAVEEIKKNTRRFAKRQLTWYRKQSHIHWFPYDMDPDQIVQRVTAILNA